MRLTSDPATKVTPVTTCCKLVTQFLQLPTALIENDDTEDLYKKKLEEAGLSVKSVPVIDFEYFNLNELHQCLQNAENFAGLVFTSPRGVHAVKLCVKTVQNLSSKWQKLPTFVVGEGTAHVLQSQLGLEGQGREAGSATNLVEFISKKDHLMWFTPPSLNSPPTPPPMDPGPWCILLDRESLQGREIVLVHQVKTPLEGEFK
ncbi:unnamed protein product, partial [Timema podura]|nr:unnamed protein product [Timema podura]